MSERSKRYYWRHREKVLARTQAWREKNPDKVWNAEISARAKERYLVNREERIRKSGEWQRKHRDERTAYHAQWRNKNKERLEAQRKANRDAINALQRKNHKKRCANPEYAAKHKEENRKWRQEHPEYIEKNKPNVKRWQDEHKALCLARSHEYRARKRAATVNPKSIAMFIERTRAKSIVTCYWCSGTISGKKCHFDHIMPLSKGGAHSIENICVSCPKCNFNKSDTLVKDWMRLGQQVMEM